MHFDPSRELDRALGSSSKAILRVVLGVVLLAESLVAVWTLIGLGLLVDLSLMLFEISALGESLSTALVVADERALLGVRAQVVKELEHVRDHAVAAVPVLALEETQLGT